jgi:DNA-binding transcriptional MerR regulator
MFKIGDFSRVARVSCRLLRYYDELGLLKPAIVDSASGYRFYSAAQLPQLNRILVLKDLGLSLEQIARLMDDGVSQTELRAMLLLRRSDVEQALAVEAERLRQIEARISQIDAEGSVADDVLIRDEPIRRVLTTRQTVGSFAEARDIIRQLAQRPPRRVAKALLGPMIGIAHSSEFEPDAIDVELGYVLNGEPREADAIEADLPLRVRELPGVAHMAVCVRVGLPEHAHLITSKIGRFVAANGYTLAGPGREVFLKPPPLDRMEEAVVEMQFPLERLGASASSGSRRT